MLILLLDYCQELALALSLVSKMHVDFGMRTTCHICRTAMPYKFPCVAPCAGMSNVINVVKQVFSLAEWH
jgi:hypothetical protein